MTVRRGFLDVKGLVDEGEFLIFENGFDGGNFFDAEEGDVTNGVMLNFAVFAKQIGRRRISVWDDGDVHDYGWLEGNAH